MGVRLVFDPKLATYRFGLGHPMRPERFTLAVDLMHAWGLLADAASSHADSAPVAEVVKPDPATDDDLLLGHTPAYVTYVKEASLHPEGASRHGLGGGDTPAFEGIHEAAALAVGATLAAVDSVLSGTALRTFNPAGGLHHAHRDYASGFCVYNDAVVAIERAIRDHPGLRVAYVDVDAHHGDGVESAFYERSEVLTLSVHESGRFLFPGTGNATDIGTGEGRGSALNVPLPPFAGPASYELVFAEVIAPALTAFAPDLVIVQGGADSHVGDPLTHLAQTVAGYVVLLERLRDLAGSLTGRRMVLLGGGGYLPFDAVPRMWAAALAVLLERPVPLRLPDAWLTRAAASAEGSGGRSPASNETFWESEPGPGKEQAEAALRITHAVIREVRAASPLLGGGL